MPLPITAFVAAVCGLLLLVTAVMTVRARMRVKVAFGDGGDDGIVRASRSHGNLAEHAPMVILLIAMLEMARVHHLGLMIIGAIFLVGRVAHIQGLHTPSAPGQPPIGRQIGVVTTWGTLLVLSIWVLWVLAIQNL